MAKREFRGKTRTDIEDKLTAWLQENAGLVSNVKRGEFVRLPLMMQTARFGNPPIEQADTFSMWIEYETKSVKPKRVVRSKRKPQPKRKR